MRGDVQGPNVVYFLLLGMLVLLVAIVMLFVGTSQKSRMLAQPLQAELVGTPAIAPISPESCSLESEACKYDLDVKGLRIRSKGEPFRAVVDVVYKGKHKLVPCPSPEHLQENGACAIDGKGASLDLAPSFEGSVWEMPPTLNFTDRLAFDGNYVLIDSQKVMLKGFSAKFAYVAISVPTPIYQPEIFWRATYLIACADDWHLVTQSEGVEDRYTMCGGDIKIKTIDIDESPKTACVNISVSGGRNFTDYDKIGITLWNETLLECASLSFSTPIALAQAIDLPSESALRCFNHMIASWELDAPVSPPSAWHQPECKATWW